ncbi:MAG: AIR synthase-related protein, partial [Alphaproteobacteria bacterium]
AIQDGLVSACHDISDGGLFVALAEMALAGKIGARVTPPDDVGRDENLPLHAWLFGEDQARYVVTTQRGEELLNRAKTMGISAAIIGATGGAALTVTGCDAISLANLALAHESWLPRYMGGSV